MALQSIGGEQLHIETVRMGNTIQAWIEDGRHITHVMLDERQAANLVNRLTEVLTKELEDA
jgi:hypothetical protein